MGALMAARMRHLNSAHWLAHKTSPHLPNRSINIFQASFLVKNE
jgi:hypothetical protein